MTGKKYFCCEASKGMYIDYYSNQAGKGVPVFVGSSGQRGHGLGSMLAGLARRALPMLTRGLKAFGRSALKTSLQVANDVADGQDWKESARNRIPGALREGLRNGIKTVADSVNDSDQTGSGRRRRVSLKRKRTSKGGFAKKRKTSKKNKKRKKNKKNKKSKRKSKKTRRDIFD